MMALALTMLLAVGGTALNRVWLDKTAMRQSQALLNQAMSELKARALRNPNGQPMGQPAAVLLSLNGQLCVFGAAPAQRNCANALWLGRPTAGIQFQNQEPNDACLAMDSAGQLLPSSVAGINCGMNLNYTISRNQEPIDGTLN
ncbi:hypothetical protein G8A07_11720 [Roseateles sp. DAIF2]|uniref:hypothetical protein n=1 Tax=Roseateles sp. DAIF2 TaxID=2714952 RepID=UPI0018A2D87E|nr:hypothetical protein [Roseateles sp. DAIF2]QPF73522.1 hypothetical protein G8A07_11720 [Roseateles sp. DAIF2]